MKLYFAPMEGITGYVFRNAFAACYRGIDTFFTPFLSNPVLNQIELHDILPENNRGIRLIPQIIANRTDTFLAIANTLKDYDYTELNLNLGCPSGTVVAKGRGSGALREPKDLDRLLYPIFEASPLPVSVKCRIGISSENEWEDIFDVLRKYPMTHLTIHPRLQKEFYRGTVHMDAFRLAYRELTGKDHDKTGPTIPLCYNGDLKTCDDFRRITGEFPDLSAVMLGRGLLENPGLAEEISGLSSPEDSRVRLRQFLSLLLTGYREEMDREGPALMKLKELWKYLQVFTGHTDKEMRPLWKTRTLAEYRDVVQMLV